MRSLLGWLRLGCLEIPSKTSNYILTYVNAPSMYV